MDRNDKRMPDQAPEAGHKPELPAGSRIQLGADGKYRWYYEYQMLKDPTILFTVWKVLALSLAIPFLLLSFLRLREREGLAAFLSNAKIFFILLAVVSALALIAYLLLAAFYGWKYLILFEMDGKGLLHAQQDKQFRKAEALGWLAAMLGSSTDKAGLAGTGILVASKSSLRTDFIKVRTIKGCRRRGRIKINELFVRNQVYTDKGDYDFVWNYLCAHCPRARIRP